MGVSKESVSKFLIGNRFHVKLRIVSPENYKQSLRVKSWKAEVTAENKQTQDYNQNFVTQAHKSQHLNKLYGSGRRYIRQTPTTSTVVVGVLPNVTIERRHFGR